MTKPGDVDYYTRVRCYQLLLSKYPADHCEAFLASAGHAHGRTTRGHLACSDSQESRRAATSSSAATTPVQERITDGKPFYGPYEAQEVFKKHEADIGVTMVPFNMMVYLEDQDKYVPA